MGLRDLDESGGLESIQQAIVGEMTVLPISGLRMKEQLASQFQTMTLSRKLALSLWLRQEILTLAQTGYPKPQAGEDFEYTPANTVGLQVFLVARSILECLEDTAILADVVGICLTTSNLEIMATLIDTLHLHHRCFAAMGALQPLFSQAVKRYQSLRHEVPLEKAYLHALADFCTTVGVNDGLVQQLSYDIARCEQRNNVAMCSPASDNAADIFTSTSMDSDEEIDRILSSGTTMDEQSMTRMFKRLTIRLEEQSCVAPPKSSRCGQWFAHLRSFDDSTFDGLMRDWLSSSPFASNPTGYRRVLPALIGSECLTLSTFVQIIDDCTQMLDARSPDARASLEIGILETILPMPASASPATASVSVYIAWSKLELIAALGAL